MYPHFANEYILLEYELGRNECMSFNRSYTWAPKPVVPFYPEIDKPRTLSSRPSRSSVKSAASGSSVASSASKSSVDSAASRSSTKSSVSRSFAKSSSSKTKTERDARASEMEGTLSCLASLFQGMYTSTLCRLMME